MADQCGVGWNQVDQSIKTNLDIKPSFLFWNMLHLPVLKSSHSGVSGRFSWAAVLGRLWTGALLRGAGGSLAWILTVSARCRWGNLWTATVGRHFLPFHQRILDYTRREEMWDCGLGLLTTWCSLCWTNQNVTTELRHPGSSDNSSWCNCNIRLRRGWRQNPLSF